MAQRLHADAFCVYVEEQAPSEREKRLVQEGFNLAERLRMPTGKLAGRPLEKLVYFAREKNATHIVLGGSERSRWQEILHGSLINALTRELKNVDILIVAAEAESSGEHLAQPDVSLASRADDRRARGNEGCRRGRILSGPQFLTRRRFETLEAV